MFFLQLFVAWKLSNLITRKEWAYFPSNITFLALIRTVIRPFPVGGLCKLKKTLQIHYIQAIIVRISFVISRMLFRFIDRKSMAIPPKFFPKSLKDFPQLDFSSEITLKNKRKNEEKVQKTAVSSNIRPQKATSSFYISTLRSQSSKCIVKR